MLRSLLDEGISVRQLATIVEALSVNAGSPRNELVARARAALGPSIVHALAAGRSVGAITLEPTLEVQLHEALRDLDGDQLLVLDPHTAEFFITQMAEHAHPVDPAVVPVVICGGGIRRPLRKFLLGQGLDLPVLAYGEVGDGTDLVGLAVIAGPPINLDAPGRPALGAVEEHTASPAPGGATNPVEEGIR